MLAIGQSLDTIDGGRYTHVITSHEGYRSGALMHSVEYTPFDLRDSGGKRDTNISVHVLNEEIVLVNKALLDLLKADESFEWNQQHILIKSLKKLRAGSHGQK